MRLYTKDFDDWSWMPAKYTADGDNVCPVFTIDDIPKEAHSLAVVCHDPDATSKVPWIHWIAWNISKEAKYISDDLLSDDAIAGTNSFGNKGYGGPSPSPGSGKHRYVFTVYALESEVNISDLKLYEEIDQILMSRAITTATWTGLYERS